MNRLFPNSRIGLLAFTLIGVWSVRGYSFQGTDDYEAALRALQDGRYMEAVELLQRSIAARPVPAQNYYPFFHLGKAFRCLGNQEEATAIFEKSFLSDELGREPHLIAALELQLSGNPPPCGEIPQMAPPPPATTSARVVQLQPTTTSAPPTSVSGASTTTVGSMPTTSVGMGTTSVGSLPLEESIVEEVRRLAESGSIREAWEKLKEAESLATSSEELAVLRNLVIESARTAARDAVVSQMRGEYDSAILGLEDAVAALSDRSTAHLYLAWACYAKYLVMGEEEATLEEKARREIDLALQIQPDIEADPRLVSPRFIELLDEIRGQAR